MNLSVVLGFFRYKNSTQLIGKDQNELFKCKIILVSIIKNMKKSNWWDFRPDWDQYRLCWVKYFPKTNN
jgi:hypothetical protein